ncbi:TOMM precursor leader peptide-binding protein [Janthinobacterium sp.]|uniref:TOMM precursor leader peptide-binding protein n=1 Tax=Janthinobacterium sp. TaxID=1871054 RepID=UPI002623BB92|nr:TOMM precursor leader peptide-binding protein [Janthinobacterium sp.]
MGTATQCVVLIAVVSIHQQKSGTDMNEKLILLPIQIVEQDDGVILKRGLEQVLIPDSNALLIIRVIQKALLQRPCSGDELLELFAAPARPLIGSLLEYLRKKRFLLPQHEVGAHQNDGQESAQDVFYWHFNQHQEQVAAALNQRRWLFVGVNLLNEKLLQAMLAEGLENYAVLDDPMLRNITLFNDEHQLISPFWQQQRQRFIDEDELLAGRAGAGEFGFVVAASEFGSFYLIERWNEFAVTNKLVFYPAVLQNMVGYAGPLVIPGETACFACLKARQNSHSNQFSEKRLTEKHAFAGQKVAAYHQSMLLMLAAVAQFDLLKFKTNIQWETGTLCEVDLLGGAMTRRKLLKAPRCPVCSGLATMPLVNIRKQLTPSDAWDEIRQTVGHHED